jgi:hypothetical protein
VRDCIEDFASVVELDAVDEKEKTMVSPVWAAAIWARREPAPLSWRFVTVSVLNRQRSSSASSRGWKLARWRRVVCMCRRAADAERFEFCGQEESNMAFLLREKKVKEPP